MDAKLGSRDNTCLDYKEKWKKYQYLLVFFVFCQRVANKVSRLSHILDDRLNVTFFLRGLQRIFRCCRELKAEYYAQVSTNINKKCSFIFFEHEHCFNKILITIYLMYFKSCVFQLRVYSLSPSILSMLFLLDPFFNVQMKY